MKFLAKSSGETIVEHTMNLVKEFKGLQNLYPHILDNKNWELLLLACKYHDLGKMNSKFQDKIAKHKKGMESGEIPHALLSVSLIPFDYLVDRYSEDDIKALTFAIAYHHERDFSNIDPDNFQNEIDKLGNAFRQIDLEKLHLPKIIEPQLPDFSYFMYGVDVRTFAGQTVYEKYVKIKGLLNRIDFAASGHYQVELPEKGYLQSNLQKNALKKWRKDNPQADWNEMQTWMGKHSKDNIVIIAQTGMGKTEGGLRWLAGDKGFFTLPLKAAINSIYDRIKNEIFKGAPQSEKHVAILHSDMQQVLLEELEKDDDFDSSNLNDFKTYLNETRSWSFPLTITTLDQVFNIVYHYRGYEPKLATLSYSKVIVDEVQMYSADLLAYLVYGLKMIQKFGGKFAVMTATLAPFVIDLFKAKDLKFIEPDHPFLSPELSQRHSVKALHRRLEADDIIAGFHNNKVLVICNTVKEAVSLYDDLTKKSKIEVSLIHSRFIRKDRKKLEEKITDFSKEKKTVCGIWIGTQVVEASLDLDFDVLYTELSELNSLFQRMGRCYRRRNFGQTGYNVFVYDGGDKLPSGVHKTKTSVYDYEMFLLSKKAITNLDGPLSEQKKIDLIEQTYTTENLKDSLYLEKVKETFEYLDAGKNDHKSKLEIANEFRNVESLTVIPEEVINQNRALIDQLHQLLQTNDYQKNEFTIMDLRNKIMDLTVQVPAYLFYQQEKEVKAGEVKLSRYQKIPILSTNYKYDIKTGLSLSSEKKEDKFDNFF